MPRQARRKSESGIYHIMLRGINQQIIFEDEEDKQKFLQTVQRYKSVCKYKLFAYCLMSNHIHILLKVEDEDLDVIIKRIAGSYVYWYNWKYKRRGHLFQDRFKSEPVDDEEYFLTVLRYIHQNPTKSGLCVDPFDYQYSSCSEYLRKSDLVDTDFCLDIISKEEFVEFHKEDNGQVCLDIEENKFRMTDAEAKSIIKKISKCGTTAQFQALSLTARDKYLKRCREKGISIRQLSRLTGVSINIIRKCT